MTHEDEHTPGELTQENATRIGTIPRPFDYSNLRMWPEDILAKYPKLIASPYLGVGVHDRGPDCDAHGCVPFHPETAAEALELRRKPAGRTEAK